ncbi:hypothetical protein BC830DRAFT_1106733 [Chytriomyces sp. MP71]|nr:hypothetical protein BC830DRAFT_1106733 [Chytriomyces sp. MP71]
MSKLERDLLAIKVAILKEQIEKDTKQREAQRQAGNGEAASAARAMHRGRGAKINYQSLDEVSSLVSRMTNLVDRLEHLPIATAVSGSSNPPTSTAEMIQTISLQNAQLHGILMANLLSGGEGMGSRVSRVIGPRDHHELRHANDSKPVHNTSYMNAPEGEVNHNQFYSLTGSGKLHRKSMRSGYALRKFKIAGFAVIFSLRLSKDGIKFRQSSRKVGHVLEDAGVHILEILKTQSGFAKGIEQVTLVTREGTNLVFKESFTNPKRRGGLLQDRIIGIGGSFLESLEKVQFKKYNFKLMLRQVSVTLLKDRFGAGCTSLRAFDYIISSNVQFPSKFLWSIEEKEYETAAPHRLNPRKVAPSSGRVLLLYYIAKLYLLKILCHPSEHGISDKRHSLLETNLVAIATFLFRAIQLACGHANEEVHEFYAQLPAVDYRSSWVSPQLFTAIQSWATRLKEWGTLFERELDKGEGI